MGAKGVLYCQAATLNLLIMVLTWKCVLCSVLLRYVFQQNPSFQPTHPQSRQHQPPDSQAISKSSPDLEYRRTKYGLRLLGPIFWGKLPGRNVVSVHVSIIKKTYLDRIASS